MEYTISKTKLNKLIHNKRGGMIKKLTDIAQEAGRIVLSIYNKSSFQVMNKEDNSALTEADVASHAFICDSLKKFYPDIPIISEESVKQQDYETRKKWEYFFLVDPLDGTKEFIKRNGEFTINIALVKGDKPIMGVIHAPVLDITYYAEENKGAHKMSQNKIIQLTKRSKSDNKICVVTSRSHPCSKTQAFLDDLVSQGKDIRVTTIGSALKFGLIAEGNADIYPRLAPTMEWDTAAGQIIVKETGKRLTVAGCDECLKYNKTELVNPGFIVQ